MPVHVTYPGVYVEELPSTEKTVSGISTSTTAFVDFFARGPMTDALQANPVQIFNYRDFQRTFGGLHTRSEASYAIMQFFANGGETAFVLRADDGSGLPAERKVEVRIPYINDFARDAADAAYKAARAARRTQGVVNGIESNFAAGEARRNLTPLAPGAAAAEALRQLPNKAPKTYKQLAGTYSLLRNAIDRSNEALTAAEKAGKDISAAKASLADATADFDLVDTRESAEELNVAVERSLGSAKKATQEAADLAKGVEAYPDGTPKNIEGVVAAAKKSVACLRSIYYSTGWATAAATERLSNLPEPTGAASLKDVSECLSAAVAAIDTARDIDDDVDALEATKLVRAADTAIEKAEGAAEAEFAAEYQAAVDATTNALAEAGKLPESVIDEAPSKFRKRRDAATKLQSAVADGGTAVQDAETRVAGIGDPPDIEKTSVAILAADTAVGAAENAGNEALELIPKHPGTDGWPGIALAAEMAADLTLLTAEGTQEAADATGAASKVLAERVLQFEAAHGAIAEQTKEAAEGAADAALEAKNAAGDAADEAEKAARKVVIEPDGDEVLNDELGNLEAAKTTITNAAEAAEKAAASAHDAADRAMDAHMAAIAAGEAGAPPNLAITAISPGVWGNEMRAVVLNGTQYRFDLQIREYATRNGKATVVNSEIYRNLSLQDENAKDYATNVVNHQSNMVRLSYKGPAVRGATPIGDGSTSGSVVTAMFQRLEGGRDGNPPGAQRLVEAMTNGLDHLAPNIFNILSLPITATYPASEASVAITSALGYCQKKRAFMIVDIPENVRSVDDMKKWAKKYGNAANFSGAVYFPRLIMPDPLQNYRPRNVGPSGTLAGIYARTDSRRGIWKAPAGVEAVIQGADVALKMTDNQDGQLNPLGVNCLRSFPVYGNISWGARTLAGADQLQSEWKYVPVRRLTDYIEESLFQALKWAVFEPNDERLWHSIKQQVGGFLSGLFVDGAFAGPGAGDSYFVHCDSTTTTKTDIANGIVNIVVGIAPVKPAEFIILQIEQIAGQD